MIQTQFGFVFLKTALDRPSRRTDSDEFFEAGALRGVAQGILDLAVGGIAQQQRSFTLGGALGAQVNSHPGEAGDPRAFFALRDLARLPVEQTVLLHQLLHRAPFRLSQTLRVQGISAR